LLILLGRPFNAQEPRREPRRRSELADPGRTGEQERVRQPLGAGGAPQPGDDACVASGRTEIDARGGFRGFVALLGLA
jgi:hypothetical protein